MWLILLLLMAVSTGWAATKTALQSPHSSTPETPTIGRTLLDGGTTYGVQIGGPGSWFQKNGLEPAKAGILRVRINPPHAANPEAPSIGRTLLDGGTTYGVQMGGPGSWFQKWAAFNYGFETPIRSSSAVINNPLVM